MERKSTFLSCMKALEEQATQLQLTPTIEVTLGIPAYENTSERRIANLYIPSTPYLYIASSVEITPSQKSTVPMYLMLQDVAVLEAHGYVDTDGIWRFENNQEIITTIHEYHKFADQKMLPHIKILIACSTDDNQRIQVQGTDELEKEGIIFINQGDAIVKHVFSPKEGVRVYLRTDGDFAKTVTDTMYT